MCVSYPQSLGNVNPKSEHKLDACVSNNNNFDYEKRRREEHEMGRNKMANRCPKNQASQKLAIKRNESKETRKTGNETGE